MTVATQTVRVVTAGNGVTTSFPVTFAVRSASDLVVIYTDSAGTATTLSPSQYSTSPAFPWVDGVGGSVTYTLSGAPIAAGTSLTVARAEPYTQSTTLSGQGAFPPETVNDALDYLTLAIQQVYDATQRALRFPLNDATGLTSQLVSAASRANKFLAFDSSGNAVASAATVSGVVATAIGASIVAAADATAVRALLGVAADFGANRLCAHKNLVGTYVSASTFTDTADFLLLLDTSNNGLLVSTFSKTADITVAGAGGLDTGAEAANTWYHRWAIAKADGTQSILLSTSATAPLMPSGYTYKGYLGAVFNDNSSNFVAQKQRGAVVSVFNATAALSAGTATTFTAPANFNRQVPPTAAAVTVNGQIGPSAGTALTTLTLSSDGSGTTATYGQAVIQNPGGVTAAMIAQARIVLTTAQQLLYFVAGANAQATIGVNGWEY